MPLYKGKPLYYSVWYYFPEHTIATKWWDIFQFKSKVKEGNRNRNDVIWLLDVTNTPSGAMRLGLIWKGVLEGPHKGDGIGLVNYPQSIATLPVGQWVHVEVYLKQSGQYDGHIIVWQDGVELYNIENVRTKHRGGQQQWSVNNYAEGVHPSPNTIYIDDAVVSTERVGP